MNPIVDTRDIGRYAKVGIGEVLELAFSPFRTTLSHGDEVITRGSTFKWWR
jgi:hypothetical protein